MEGQILDSEIVRDLRRAGVTDEGIQLIQRIRRSPAPIRRVKNGRSVLVRLPSYVERKILTLESEREAYLALLKDGEINTLALSEQPCWLRTAVERDGETVVVETVPDLLALEQVGATPAGMLVQGVFYEVTSQEDMERLQREDPDRFTYDGKWHDRYIEHYVREALGCEYRIVTVEEMPPKVIRNRSHLRDLTITAIQVPSDVRMAVIAAVKKRPGCTGSWLQAQVSELDPMHLDQMVCDRDIWFPADRELLKDLSHVHFFPGRGVGLAILAQPTRPVDAADLDLSVGAEFKWGEQVYKIVNATREKLECLVDGAIVALPVAEVERRYEAGDITGQARAADPALALVNASDKTMAGYLRRVARLREADLGGRSDRHTARLRRKIDSVQKIDGTGAHALVPNYANCGRRGSRISPEDKAHALDTIEKQFLTPEQRTLSFAFDAYKNTFAGTVGATVPGSRPMSWPTFRKFLYENWTPEQIARARQGARAANAAAMRAPLGGGRGAYAGVPHADRADQVHHFDDSQLDMWLRDSITGEERGRPWGSLEVDSYSTRIMEVALGYADPSKATMLELLRLHADRYGSFPECGLTDNAKYYGATAVLAAAEFHGMTLKRRPPAHGRYGSQVEGAFKWLNAALRNLAGSNKPNQRPRSLDSELAPEKRALWTLPEAETIVRELIRIHNATPDPVTGKSPDDLYGESIARTGTRPLRRVRLNRSLMIMTSPPRGKFRVGQQGVQVDGVNYWCEEFRLVQGEYVEVKDEMWDITTKYAYVDGEWRDCRTERFWNLENVTAEQLRVMSKEIRLRLKRQATEDDLVRFILDLQRIEERKRAGDTKAKRSAPRIVAVPKPVEEDEFAKVAAALERESTVAAGGHDEVAA